jgi:cyclopropane fatty-acyl-phospholipid synthase-like methyltransferase
MIEEKPYALSCDRNSQPILDQLKKLLSGRKSLLEVGAGTGQHAVFMAPHFLDMNWTLSDQEDRHPGIQIWMKDFPRSNVKGPVEYTVGQSTFPQGEFDVVFTSNTLHIMGWDLCLQFFDDLSRSLPKDALFIVYGAFNYNGQYTSESNKDFDRWLKEKHPESGIRGFEEVRDELAQRHFQLVDDIEMPANNRMLVFKKLN